MSGLVPVSLARLTNLTKLWLSQNENLSLTDRAELIDKQQITKASDSAESLIHDNQEKQAQFKGRQHSICEWATCYSQAHVQEVLKFLTER